MSISVVMVLVIIMSIGMIGMVIWYLNRGYSYKHTVDELPPTDSIQPKEKEE